jgi:hypothetical protein
MKRYARQEEQRSPTKAWCHRLFGHKRLEEVHEQALIPNKESNLDLQCQKQQQNAETPDKSLAAKEDRSFTLKRADED